MANREKDTHLPVATRENYQHGGRYVKMRLSTSRRDDPGHAQRSSPKQHERARADLALEYIGTVTWLLSLNVCFDRG